MTTIRASIRQPLCVLTTLAMAAVIAAPATIVAAPPAASMTYRLPKSTTLGEPAILAVTLSNSTGYRIVADFGVDDQTEFEFLHHKPDGGVERVKPPRPAADRDRTAHLMLRGTEYRAMVVLDDWLDMASVGRHTIDVEFHGTVQIDGGGPAGLDRMKTLVIDVKPHDAVRLGKRCADWLKQVSTLSPDHETRAAGRALARIDDPVVIPDLELAAARTRQPIFFDALMNLTQPDAHAALERLAKSDDPDVRTLAKRALGGR